MAMTINKDFIWINHSCTLTSSICSHTHTHTHTHILTTVHTDIYTNRKKWQDSKCMLQFIEALIYLDTKLEYLNPYNCVQIIGIRLEYLIHNCAKKKRKEKSLMKQLHTKSKYEYTINAIL